MVIIGNFTINALSKYACCMVKTLATNSSCDVTPQLTQEGAQSGGECILVVS